MVAPMSANRRNFVRRGAAVLAVVIAAFYFLIGFGVVTVLENQEGQFEFGMIAGVAFLIGAALIWRFDSRPLWALGAMAQALIIYMYFALAPDRVPDFEFWGVAIRVSQLLLFGALTYLAIRPKEAGTKASARMPQEPIAHA